MLNLLNNFSNNIKLIIWNLDLNKHRKIQLNCHPFSWTLKGYDNLNNFRTLADEKRLESIYSLNDETKTFPKELLL